MTKNEKKYKDLEEIPKKIKTKYGQSITIPDNIYIDNILKENILIPCAPTQRINIKFPTNKNPELNNIITICLIIFIENKSNFYFLSKFLESVSGIDIEEDCSEEQAFEIIKNWAMDYISCNTIKDDETAIYQFISEGCEREAFGFNYEIIEQIKLNKKSNKEFINKYFDQRTSPYTTKEINIISKFIQSNECSKSHKALLTLYRNYGLRPIQIAILRVEDIKKIDNTYSLNIFGVKGREKSLLRRHEHNRIEIAINKETYESINEMIIENSETYLKIQNYSDSFFSKNNIERKLLPRALFPRLSDFESMNEYLLSPVLWQWSGHRKSPSLVNFVNKIPERIDDFTGTENNIHINAYKFRRTIATRLSILGFNTADISNFLDHKSSKTTKGYIELNNDSIAHLNATFTQSTNMVKLVEHWNKKVVKPESTKGSKKISKNILNIGICLKDSYCTEHPIVSCYTCHQFNPYIDGNHEESIRIIEKTKKEFDENSTFKSGLIFTDAIQNAKAIIKLKKEN